ARSVPRRGVLRWAHAGSAVLVGLDHAGHARRAHQPHHGRAGENRGAPMMSPGWYLRRLSRMGPREVAGRVTDAARKRQWRHMSAYDGTPTIRRHMISPGFHALLPTGTILEIPDEAKARLLATADRLMDRQAD